jgi:hypothetical protein
MLSELLRADGKRLSHCSRNGFIIFTAQYFDSGQRRDRNNQVELSVAGYVPCPERTRSRRWISGGICPATAHKEEAPRV